VTEGNATDVLVTSVSLDKCQDMVTAFLSYLVFFSFNDTVSHLDYVVLNGWMVVNNVLESMWK